MDLKVSSSLNKLHGPNSSFSRTYVMRSIVTSADDAFHKAFMCASDIHVLLPLNSSLVPRTMAPLVINAIQALDDSAPDSTGLSRREIGSPP